MSKKILLLTVVLLLVTPSVRADDNLCPCIPMSYVWVVTACETWNCAQSAMILANGDPFVMAMPTGSDQHKWVVMRRVAAGSVTVSPDEPFIIDSYETMGEASTQYSAADPHTLPMLVSGHDGKALLVRLRQPQQKRAAAAH